MALCVLWPLAGAMAARAQAEGLMNLLEPNYAPFFCIGILLYLVYRSGWSTPLVLLLGLNYSIALWVCSAYFVPWSAAVWAPVSFAGVAVLFTLSVAAIIVATLTPVSRIDWRWLSAVGALTYPLYLVHEYPGWVLMHWLEPRMSPAAVVAVTVAFMLLVAHVVHRWCERPLGGWLRRTVERDLTEALPDTEVVRNRVRTARRAFEGRNDPLAPHAHPEPPARHAAVPAPALPSLDVVTASYPAHWAEEAPLARRR
jgi:peptidoglycan/LPS O-acetylase OafA/YrhL